MIPRVPKVRSAGSTMAIFEEMLSAQYPAGVVPGTPGWRDAVDRLRAQIESVPSNRPVPTDAEWELARSFFRGIP